MRSRPTGHEVPSESVDRYSRTAPKEERRSDPPTIRPPFDPEAYASESEMKLRLGEGPVTARPGRPTSQRPTPRPPFDPDSFAQESETKLKPVETRPPTQASFQRPA